MNFIKSIYSHMFDSPLALANTVFMSIALIFTFIFILGELFALNRDYLNKVIQYLKCFKSVKDAYYNTVDIFKYLGEQVLCSLYVYIIIFCISLVLFIISTIYVEYPCGGVIYTKDGGQWNRHEGRIYTAPFWFNGCTVYPGNYSNTVILDDIFKLKYHIDEYNSQTDSMRQVLKCLDSTSSILSENIQKLIRKKYKILVFSTDRKDLLDPKTRLKIFQDFYTPYSITIDSVDML